MTDIIITGIGGQGTVSLGHLLGETLNELDIPYVAAETHGMSQRGGSVIFHLRVGKWKRSPLIERQTADIIISGEPMEALRALEYLKPNGVIVTEQQGILSPVANQMGYKYPDKREIYERLKSYTNQIYAIDAIEKARLIGNTKIANIVLLGKVFSLEILPLSAEAVRQYIKKRWPNFVDKNMEAFDLGLSDKDKNIELLIV